MGKKSLAKVTGLTQDQRISLAQSGKRVNLNNHGNKPEKVLKNGKFSNVPLDLENILLGAVSTANKATVSI